MKKFTIALLAVLAFSFSLKAQQFVSTTPSNRNIVIEEFTGRNCGYCPSGQVIANGIVHSNPGRVWAVNIHAGGLSPTNYPNLQCQDGINIHNGFSISGYPSGTVNRCGGNQSYGRGQWSSLTNQQLGQQSEVNIGGRVVINPATRTATITVEAYYTADAADASNQLTVVMLQDSIWGGQSGGATNPEQWVNGQYCHMHILRDVVNSTSPWGEPISPTTAGTLITKEYVYEIPEMIGNPNGVVVDMHNVHFLAWVSKNNYYIMSANELSVSCLEESVITTSSNPTNGGSTTGGGTYNQGASCTVRATANSGYTFSKWTENGTQVSTNANYTFTVTGNRNLVAHFTQDVVTYTIATSSNPSNGGSTSGGGTYNQGASCTVRATANSGYTFSKWTENGTQVSTNANYTFTVTGNRNLVAHFTQDVVTYTIATSSNPTNGGSTTGGGTYNQGASCTVRATANSGYTFAKWTENGTQVSTNANYTFTVTGNRNLVAHFTQDVVTYTIATSSNPSNGGSTSGGGTYNQGASCTVTATANSGYTFSKWTENGTQVSTNANYTFTVTGNRNLVANFTQDVVTYTIATSSNPTNGGSTTGSGTYNQGASCTVRATANSGYTFSKWTENGTQVSTNANYTFTVTGNRNLVAHFTQDVVTYTIATSSNPSNGGSTSGGGTYDQGASCTVRATANSGYTFSKWTENGTQVSTNANYTFTVTGNRNLVANFTQDVVTYTIATSSNPTNGGSTTGSGTYNQGASCTVRATANSGYTFSKWTENGTQVSTEASYTFTVTGSRSLVAHFVAETFAVTVESSDPEMGTATGGGNFTSGQTCGVFARANTGYFFVNWTENGTVVSTDAFYSFAVSNNCHLVAHFAIEESVGDHQKGYEIYPNPASDRLTVSSTDEISVLKVYNMVGSVVYSAEDCGLQTVINLDGLPDGVYFLQLTRNGMVETTRFIKE